LATGQAYLVATGGQGDTRRYQNNGLRPTPNVYTGWDTGAVIKWDGGAALQLKSQTYYKRYERSSVTDLDNTPLPFFHTTGISRAYFFSQELQATGRLFDRLQYVSGLYYSYESGFEGSRSLVNAPANAPLNDANVANTSYGAYLQGTYAITSALSLTAGVRYSVDHRWASDNAYIATTPDSFDYLRCNVLKDTTPSTIPQSACHIADKLTERAVNYNVTLQYKITPDFNIYAAFRSGYRAGGFNITTSGGIGLRPFAPENTTDQEVGIKSEWFDHRLRFNVAGYHSSYNNIQRSSVVVFSITTGVQTQSVLVANAASATIQGVEVEFNAVPSRSLSLNGFFNYVDAHYNKYSGAIAVGQPVVDLTFLNFGVPKLSSNLGATYTWFFEPGQLSARVDWRWQSSQVFAALLTQDQTFETQGAYSLLDARVEWRMPEHHLTIAFVGRNLTNKYYRIASTQLRGQAVDFNQIGDPRYLGFEIVKTFGGG